MHEFTYCSTHATMLLYCERSSLALMIEDGAITWAQVGGDRTIAERLPQGIEIDYVGTPTTHGVPQSSVPYMRFGSGWSNPVVVSHTWDIEATIENGQLIINAVYAYGGSTVVDALAFVEDAWSAYQRTLDLIERLGWSEHCKGRAS